MPVRSTRRKQEAIPDPRFMINDTYRTDVHLLYPPYVISLAVLYLGFCLTSMSNPTGARTRSSSSQMHTLSSAVETNAALGLPPPPTGAAEFIASFQVSLPVLLACVQDIIVLYPIWETFEPSTRPPGGAPTTLAAAAAGLNKAATDGKDANKDRFGPEQAEQLVRFMIESRAKDAAGQEPAPRSPAEAARTVSGSLAGKKRRAH